MFNRPALVSKHLSPTNHLTPHSGWGVSPMISLPSCIEIWGFLRLVQINVNNLTREYLVIHVFFVLLKIGNLEKNVQNLKVQLAGAHGNHKEAMDQVINSVEIVVNVFMVIAVKIT